MRDTTTTARRIPRALLLDFGSVISVSVFERHRDTEQLLGLPAGCLTWLGPIRPDTDPLWQSMQQDRITERDYWARRADELGRLAGESGWDMPTMLARIRQVDPDQVVRPAMLRLVTQAHAAGLRLGILTNELELFYGSEFLQRMQILRLFDVIVDATHTKILKPDPRAYAAAIDGLAQDAADILFVDDQFRNIAGGVAAGLQTQYFDLRDVRGQIAAIAARLDLSIADIV